MRVEFTLDEAVYITRLLAIHADNQQKYLFLSGSEIATVEEQTRLRLDLQTTGHLIEKMFEAMNKAVKDNESSND
jgi:hypothetical protein